MESSSADSDYQQLEKLRIWYEEYVKLSKETIPNAEKELQQVKEELDHKSQALDDVIIIFSFKYFLELILSRLSLHVCHFLFLMYGFRMVITSFVESCICPFLLLTCFSLYNCCNLFQVLGILAQVKTDKELVEPVVKYVEHADRIFLEIQTLQKKVEDLESELGCGGPEVRTLEEIQLELVALQGTK